MLLRCCCEWACHKSTISMSKVDLVNVFCSFHFSHYIIQNFIYFSVVLLCIYMRVYIWKYIFLILAVDEVCDCARKKYRRAQTFFNTQQQHHYLVLPANLYSCTIGNNNNTLKIYYNSIRLKIIFLHKANTGNTHTYTLYHHHRRRFLHRQLWIHRLPTSSSSSSAYFYSVKTTHKN